MISLFLRKFFRFKYQLLWSEQDQPAFAAFHNHVTAQDQPAFAAFHNHVTADECLPFIINGQKEHPYFFKPDTIKKQAIDYICFNPRLITENNLHDDNRPYRYEQNFQEQQDLFTKDNYDEDDTNKEEHMLENQNENCNEDIALNINENNASEYHKLRHQQLPNLLEFQLGFLVKDKTHMIHNHTQIHLHIVT